MIIVTVLIFILVILKTLSFHFLHKSNSIWNSAKDSLIFIPSVFMQQFMLFSFWSFFINKNFTLTYQILICAFVFSLVHVLLLMKLNKKDALLIIFLSFFGGGIFIFMYAQFELGLWLAFLFHLSFHVVLDFVYFKLNFGPMKNRA